MAGGRHVVASVLLAVPVGLVVGLTWPTDSPVAAAGWAFLGGALVGVLYAAVLLVVRR